MKTRILIASGLALALTLQAAPQSFDFKDAKGVNNAVFKLDAPLESINGTASGISGVVTYNPENPAATTGKIVVAANSLTVPNPVMKEHMHGAQWLDVEKHPLISFEVARLANVKRDGDNATADVTGRFTMRGVTREITAPVRFTYLRDRLGERGGGRQGDLLVIRSRFTINRGDYNVNPGAPADKVAEQIEITLSVAGAAPRP